MLDEKTLNDFISEVDHAYQQFYVWQYIHNGLVKYSKKWLIPARGWHNKKISKFGNSWDVINIGLQNSWVLSISRLFDNPFFNHKDKKTKKIIKKERFSIYRLLKSLNDDVFELKIKNELGEHSKHGKCIKSIQDERNDFLAHKDFSLRNKVNRKIEPGIEKLFKGLNKIISEIKNKGAHLKNCSDIDFKHIRKICKNGVERIFQELSTK